MSQALSVVAAEKRDDEDRELHPVTIALAHAALSDNPEDRTEFVSDLISAGMPTDVFIEVYAADAARYLGDMWGANKLSFVDVTIGTARLQETVRKLSGRHPNLSASERRPEILLATPLEENHVFGIMVAATKFEALGCHVRLAVGQTPTQIAEFHHSQSFDMFGISLSHTRFIRSVKDIVKAVRRTPQRTPIVLGGSLTDDPALDLKDTTGVDHVISDAKKALRLCNIELPSLATTREATTKNGHQVLEG